MTTTRVIPWVALALLAGGCGVQPAGPLGRLQTGTPLRAEDARTVRTAATPLGRPEAAVARQLVLSRTMTWNWSDRTEIELEGKLEGFRTRITVTKDLKTGKVDHQLSFGYMSKWELVRTLEEAELEPGAWKWDVRRAIDLLQWGRSDAPTARPEGVAPRG